MTECRFLPLLLVACATEPAPPTPPTPPTCRTFAPLARAAPFTTVSSAPLHPSGIVADPHVAFADGRYQLWFTAVDWTAGTVFDATDRRMGTAYAESDDGILWDDTHVTPVDPAHKVDLVLAPGTWDSAGVETASVVATDTGYLLVHTGDRPDGTYAIGRATSIDGLAWQRDPTPLLDAIAPWEQPLCLDDTCSARIGGLFEPALLIDPDGTLHVWYATYGIRGDDLATVMGHAWSRDAGATWQRSPTPVFEPGAPGAWDEVLVSHTNVIADPGGGYHLFYQGISRAQQQQCSGEGSCPFYTPGSIGHAFSEDGTTWTREPAPVLAPDAARGEGYFVGGPSALIRDGQLELFYFGIASHDDATMLRATLARATARCD